MKTELNAKERRMYDYIDECLERDGYAPSVRDIQNALGIKSTSTVHSYLSKLEKMGFIHKEQGKSRTLRTRSDGVAEKSVIKVPVLGRVTAGMPVLAEESFEGYVDFPVSKSSQKYNNYFALNVEGESMIEAGIFDGDIVIVRKTDYAENGKIVVAMIDDEATVKTFYKEKNHFRLQPENSSMKPIIANEIHLLGVVSAVMRYYN